MKIKKNVKGFSLVELMIAIAVLAILAAVGAPTYTKYIRKGHASVAKGDLLSIGQKMQAWRQTKMTYTGADISTLYSNVSPISGTAQYDLALTVNASGTSFTVSAMPIAGSLSQGNGTYWFNIHGDNCWYPNSDSAAYTANCAGGEAWEN